MPHTGCMSNLRNACVYSNVDGIMSASESKQVGTSGRETISEKDGSDHSSRRAQNSASGAEIQRNYSVTPEGRNASNTKYSSVPADKPSPVGSRAPNSEAIAISSSTDVESTTVSFLSESGDMRFRPMSRGELSDLQDVVLDKDCRVEKYMSGLKV